jgi:DNA repair exonuclease SbcCD ATPase subunit
MNDEYNNPPSWIDDDIKKKLARDSRCRSPLEPWSGTSWSVADLLFEYEEEIQSLREEMARLSHEQDQLISNLSKADYQIERLKIELEYRPSLARVERELRAKDDAMGLLEKAYRETGTQQRDDALSRVRDLKRELETAARARIKSEELAKLELVRLEKERDEALANVRRLEQERAKSLEELRAFDRVKDQNMTIDAVRVVDMDD